MLVRLQGPPRQLAWQLARPPPAPASAPLALRRAPYASLAPFRRPARTSGPRSKQVEDGLIPEITPKTRAGAATPASAFVKRYIPNLAALYSKTLSQHSGKAAVVQGRGSKALSGIFEKCLKGGRVARLSVAYREMMAAVRPGEDGLPISVDQLRAAIQLVGRAGADDHWTLLETMFHDLDRLFGSPPTLEDHRALLYFLANSSTPRAAFSRLETIPLSIAITATDFNVVLAGLSRAGDLEGLRSCMEQLPLLDLQPDEQTVILLLKGLFAGHTAQSQAAPAAAGEAGAPKDVVDLPALRAEVSRVLDDMRPRGLPESPEVWAVLAEGYLQVGDVDTSRKAAGALRSALRHAKFESLRPAAWNALVRCTSVGESSDKAMREVFRMTEAGVKPNGDTVQALLESAPVGTLDDVRQLLQQVETVAGVLSTAPHWATLIDRVVHRDGNIATRAGLEEALKVYRESAHQQVEPSADMILPIVATLCNPAYQASADARETDLNTALALYDDLLAAEQARYVDIVSQPTPPVPYSTDVGALLEPRPPSFGPTIEVYDILLEGISSSRTIRTHDQAWELLGDMKARGLYFDPPTTVRHIRGFMARALTHKYAFGCYDRFLKLHPPSLGASKEAFLAVADTFIHKTCKEPLVNPHPRLVFEFIIDMRRAGYDESHAVMTTFFSQLANLSYTGAEMSTREENEAIIKRMTWCTRLAVAWCRTDPFIKIDKHLLNAMMNALTRVGCMQDAYEVWMIVSEAEQFDEAANNASVNIILDAVGLHGDPAMLEQLWKWLRDGSFPLSLSNWHAVIHACLRLGALPLLVRLVTVDMRQNLGSPPAPSPTADTLRRVLEYQDGFRHGVLNRNFLRGAVETSFPDLWAEVKDTPSKDWWAMEMLDEEREMGDAIKPLLLGTEFEQAAAAAGGEFAEWEAGSDRDDLEGDLAQDEAELQDEIRVEHGRGGQEQRPKRAAASAS